MGSVDFDVSSGLEIAVADTGGEVSLTGVLFDGVIVDRTAGSTGTVEAGDFARDGVFDVAIEGDWSRLSNCSRREATPLAVGLGERGVGD